MTSPTEIHARARRPRANVVRRYRDGTGLTRELVARPAARGSVLLVDRDPLSRSGERLVAHLAADEPRENAAIAASVYLATAPAQRRCRAPLGSDAETTPLLVPGSAASHGCRRIVSAFELSLIDLGSVLRSLRWTRGGREAVSLREAIGTVQSYEPLCTLTRSALARAERDPSRISTSILRAELTRVLESPIVLNRALREVVLDRVANGGVSMSEIAIRCGRVKRDARGRVTGETSWLSRRIGLLPEGGQAEPTRWVHTDVLALIAREGLGIAPREVELG
jgi:hypothetical protein